MLSSISPGSIAAAFAAGRCVGTVLQQPTNSKVRIAMISADRRSHEYHPPPRLREFQLGQDIPRHRDSVLSIFSRVVRVAGGGGKPCTISVDQGTGGEMVADYSMLCVRSGLHIGGA